MMIRFISAFAASLLIGQSSFAQDVNCSAGSSDQFKAAVEGGLLECSVNPDLLRIRVYQMALCSSLPTISDTSSCKFVYNAPSGRVVSISSGTTAPLTGVFELDYDNYPYVYVVIDNTVAFKSTFTLPDPVGVLSTVQEPNPTGYGNTCWTNGNDAKQDFTDDPQPVNVECGATPNAQVSTEIFRSFTDSMIPSVSGIPGVGGDTFDAHLIDSNGDLATIVSDNGHLVSSNADKLVLIQHSASPLVINENTRNIDLGFATTDRMNVQFFPCQINSATDECAAYSFTTGFQIHATSQ